MFVRFLPGLRPTPSVVIASMALGVALVVALGEPAVSAAASLVTLADPTTPAYKAHVDSTGKLLVGDGAGALTVDGTVITQRATPANFFHQSTFNFSGGGPCVTIATPPSTRALIVTQVRIDVFADGSPGAAQNVALFLGTSCDGQQVGDVNPPTVGPSTVTFDPGIGVPAGSGMSAEASGGIAAETYVDGFTVASNAVPSATSPAAKPPGSSQQH